MKRIAFSLLLFLVWFGVAFGQGSGSLLQVCTGNGPPGPCAQSPVGSGATGAVPLPVQTQSAVLGTSTNESTTIGTGGGTFQSVLAASSTRHGCLIQNTGTGTMWIFIGPIASATEATSFEIIPPATNVQGGSFSCGAGNGQVIQDQVSITGTAGDTFTAISQ